MSGIAGQGRLLVTGAAAWSRPGDRSGRSPPQVRRSAAADHPVVSGGKETVELITDVGVATLVVECDVTGPGCRSVDLIAAAVATYGGLDYAYNNFGHRGPPGAGRPEMTDAEFRRVLDVNLMVRLLLHEVRDPRDVGSAVAALSSTARRRRGCGATPTMRPYVVSKHAVAGTRTSTALESPTRGIRIVSIDPGRDRERR